MLPRRSWPQVNDVVVCTIRLHTLHADRTVALFYQSQYSTVVIHLSSNCYLSAYPGWMDSLVDRARAPGIQLGAA